MVLLVSKRLAPKTVPRVQKMRLKMYQNLILRFRSDIIYKINNYSMRSDILKNLKNINSLKQLDKLEIKGRREAIIAKCFECSAYDMKEE